MAGPNMTDTLRHLAWLSVLTVLAVLAVQPAHSQEQDSVLVVPHQQLSLYWTPENAPAPRYPLNASRRLEEGCSTIGYVIEANGTTSSHQVLASWPNDKFANPSLEAARQFTYSPTADNSEREAVYTTYTFTFVLDRNEKEIAEMQENLVRVCLGSVSLGAGSN